jgi:hypothetical protein
MPERIARLSILDSYGVRWTRETFARDLLQNFFDAAADFRTVALDVRVEEGTVEIRGQETFDIDLLAYIGATTKTTGHTAGGFGEGFKICALVGARDFGLTITAGSGGQEIAVFFDRVPLGRELCYRVTTREDPAAGSYVRLEGCDAACIAAFQAAPAMFRHPDNPALREPVVVDHAAGVGVYRAPEGRDGELYYRRQRRGTARFYCSARERPLTLAHDGIIEALEGDRDRRDLPAEPLARAVGEKLAPEDLHRVLLELMPYWKYGNDVLSGLLAAAVARKLCFTWPPRWLARSHKAPALVAFAERQGFSIALASFADVGMPTPTERYSNLETRAASALERAQFQVVADLYAGLLGKPAQVTELEVFDLEGSAVAGQHLGDKVIVGAELFAGGFDAVSGTILHELAHEAGGEEDIRFLRRLTNLLGAAIREPEKIREARRRYAAARPARARREAPKGPAQKEAYTPEHPPGGSKEDVEGVICTVLVPPGFPPSERIVAAVRAAATDAGVGVWVMPVHVSGPIGAVSWRAPGIPTLYIGGQDPEPLPEGRATPGYHLRTYGPDGHALVPDHEALRAAIVRAKERRVTGRVGLSVHHNLREGRRERVRALLGIQLPKEEERRERTEREKRDDTLRSMIMSFIEDDGGFELEDVWAHGQLAAAEVWIRAARRDRRPAGELFDGIADRLDMAGEQAIQLRDADPDYDDADAFEREAMLVAMGAAVSAYALGADEADAEARAAEAFRVVRAGAAHVLDLDVTQDGKGVVLLHAAKCAGLGYHPAARTRSFEAARFQEGLARGSAEALRMQRSIDEEGGFFHAHDLRSKLDPFAEEPRVARNSARNRRWWARFTASTHAVRAAYERALAESGSEIEAAARCLEVAARRMPEARR